MTAPPSFTPSLSVSHPSPSLFHFHSFSVSITLGSLLSFFFLTCFSPFSVIYMVVWIHKSKNIWTTTNNLKQTKKDRFLQFITLKCSSVYNLVLAFQYQVHKNILPVPESVTVAYCSTYYPPCIQNSITILNNWLFLQHQYLLTVYRVTTLVSTIPDNSAVQQQHKLLCWVVWMAFFFLARNTLSSAPLLCFAVILLLQFHPATLQHGFSWSYIWHRKVKSCAMSTPTL